MKRILKLKKIKKTNITKKYISSKRKTKRNWRKMFSQINSPHNTNKYLISVNSSPFYNYEDDDEYSINIIPSSFIKIPNDINSELEFFINRESEFTNEKTILMEKQKEQNKELIQRLLR